MTTELRIEAHQRTANTKNASASQLTKFADQLCQGMLKKNLDIITLEWQELYDLLHSATGCGVLDTGLFGQVVKHNTFAKVQFLISFGNRVVVICKDANFAPIEYP